MFELPEGARAVLQRLNDNGHEAWVVGGCVRDSLLGRVPKDWDICTSATPEQMLEVFRGWHVIETGLKHGTVTVMLRHEPYEVTTYRLDGAYTDHRHPDEVTFVTDVVQDLARRDFTVNAMAYHPVRGLCDPFGGQADLQARLIRCVGKAEERFTEDALRILRALRFSATYQFTIESETSDAVHRLHPTLSMVAAERVRVELGKLLCGPGAEQILRDYADVITGLIPELAPCIGFEQLTVYHTWDVWEHTLHALGAVRPTEALRLTMLLHDSGKPAVFTIDEQGRGHSYGHAKVSVRYAEAVLGRLKTDNETRDRVLRLVEHHDIELSADRHLMLCRLAKFGEEMLRELIEVHRADSMGKGKRDPAEINAWAQSLNDALDALLLEKPCFTLKDLAIGGKELIAAGCPKGPAMGQCLQHLLNLVVEEKLPNTVDALLTEAANWLEQTDS